MQMEYILATYCFGGIEDDLRIPSFVPVCDLIEALNEIYSTDGKMLHAQPKGIILDKGKTLAEQGVGNGALLTMS
jgi:uncharacterized ubiquitin-like protein YukD